jgi:hypothetical protein
MRRSRGTHSHSWLCRFPATGYRGPQHRQEWLCSTVRYAESQMQADTGVPVLLFRAYASAAP